MHVSKKKNIQRSELLHVEIELKVYFKAEERGVWANTDYTQIFM